MSNNISLPGSHSACFSFLSPRLFAYQGLRRDSKGACIPAEERVLCFPREDMAIPLRADKGQIKMLVGIQNGYV